MFIAHARILTAFDLMAVGSRVIQPQSFRDALKTAIEAHDTSRDRVPGQSLVTLPPSAYPTVSAGVGRRENHGPADFVLRSHRGKVGAYLQRAYAAPVESLQAVVYSIEAYSRDPDTTPEEMEDLTGYPAQTPTHILVAVLAHAGPPAPLTPGRFVANLAGGNREAQVWTADEIRAKAVEIAAYSSSWCVVAD